MNQYYLKYVKPWREKNPEKVKAQLKRYLAKHKEEIYKKQNARRRIQYKKWRKTHPYQVAPPGMGFDTIRLKALARDNCLCRICSLDGQEVHHLDGTGSNHLRKKQNNKLNNLITVCHKCHIKLDLKLKKLKNGFNKGKWREEKERNVQVIELSKTLSQTQISKLMGITRQRVNQIINKLAKREASLTGGLGL